MRDEYHNHCSLPANWLVYALCAPLEVGLLILFGSYHAVTLLFFVLVAFLDGILRFECTVPPSKGGVIVGPPALRLYKLSMLKFRENS